MCKSLPVNESYFSFVQELLCSKIFSAYLAPLGLTSHDQARCLQALATSETGMMMMVPLSDEQPD